MKTRFNLGIVSAALWMTTGCATAVGAGAGAAAGVAYTDRGAKGDVKGSVSDVNKRAREVFKELGIQTTETSSTKGGTEQSLSGKKGETEASVQMTEIGKDTTHVEVVAREGLLKWNKDYAKDVLNRIIQKG